MKNVQWLRSIFATIVALAIYYIGYIIFDINMLDHLSKQESETDVISYFYAIENRDSNDEDYSCFYDDRIVIFDLEGTKSRAAVANAIKQINACRPSAIAIDVIFSEATEVDALTDAYLSESIASCQNLYTACRIVDGGVERSFYEEALGVPSGLVNRTTHYRPYEVIAGDTIQYLPYLIAKEVGNENASHLVSYFDKEFAIIRLSDSIVPEDIEGRIVLVGDLGDMRDMHDMPFRIGGKWRVPGTVLMAYDLSTIIHDSWVVKLPAWWAVCVAALFTFLFICFCYKLRASERIDVRWRNFIEIFLRIILIVALMFLGYYLFARYHVMLNLVVAMVAIALTGISIDIIALWDWVREKFGKIK